MNGAGKKRPNWNGLLAKPKREWCNHMMRLRVFVLLLTCATAASAFAQRAEVSVDGSLLVFYPAKTLAGARNLYGGGASFVYNFRPHLGLKSEFQGYLSSTADFHVSANPPTIPASGTFESHMHMFTYLFGPQLSLPVPNSNVRIYAEALFGGAYTNVYSNFFKAASITGVSPSNNGFAMAFGGGVDLAINEHLAFRPVQLDYVRTRYAWQNLGIHNQNNVRYEAGLVFVWGEL